MVNEHYDEIMIPAWYEVKQEIVSDYLELKRNYVQFMNTGGGMYLTRMKILICSIYFQIKHEKEAPTKDSDIFELNDYLLNPTKIPDKEVIKYMSMIFYWLKQLHITQITYQRANQFEKAKDKFHVR